MASKQPLFTCSTCKAGNFIFHSLKNQPVSPSHDLFSPVFQHHLSLNQLKNHSPSFELWFSLIFSTTKHHLPFTHPSASLLSSHPSPLSTRHSALNCHIPPLPAQTGHSPNPVYPSTQSDTSPPHVRSLSMSYCRPTGSISCCWYWPLPANAQSC